jgi:ribosomal protein S18 acetylase RimI-like enzyme
VLAAPATVRNNSASGPRPINLARDIRGVLTLMDAAFGPVRDWSGQRMLGERVIAGYGAPFSLRLSMLTKGFIPGFVWEEDGRLVGNVSLLESSVPGRYLIANVAVDPVYRRRGIARGLMHEAVKHICQLGGKRIVLQVEEDNEPAIALYRSLDFSTVGVMKKWETTAARLRFPHVNKDSGARIRPVNRGDWRAASRLDAATVDPDLNWPAPLAPTHFKVGLWHAIGDFLNGRRVETWVSDAALGASRRKHLTGLATVNSEWGRPHQVTVRLDPEWRDRVAAPLLVQALGRAKRLRGGIYRISHPSDDEVVTELLAGMNFKVRRTLTVMRLHLENA